MTALLLSGLGPAFMNEGVLRGTLFDPDSVDRLRTDYYPDLTLADLGFERDGRRHPLLRPARGRGSSSLRIDGLDGITAAPVPHLTTATLESILDAAATDYEAFDLSGVWQGDREPVTPSSQVHVVLLSTTFIWDHRSMSRAIRWAADRYPGVPIVLGGQYSNLKYLKIMAAHPEVTCVVRGDAEEALPLLLRAVAGGGDWRDVPNLVVRTDDGRIAHTDFRYVDIEVHPSPTMRGRRPIVPYESMRGCPFSCKFCSFPAASPKWRYKSAKKIATDWAGYAEVNGARHIRASDSTFTVPPTRLRELFDLLPEVGIGWEAFARANAIRDAETVDRLLTAHCRWLSIGFESMSDRTLTLMKKQVTAAANRRAFQLLSRSDLGYRCSFILGYPGETPEDFGETATFLRDEYAGHFTLSIFSLQDETMPVWEDAEQLGIEVDDPEAPDYSWRHHGMDIHQARQLWRQTLEEVRWGSDTAVHLLWQKDYETPLIPWRDARTNFRLEKLVERLAMLPTAEPDPRRARPRIARILDELAREGVSAHPAPVARPAG
ncbi:B12-binding domain-containing radical SAM protein [Micromonospora sp. NPDC049903]|uniref:B12-binding domain-containing radical SAM protein n=1 Tax=Micromonospora sp. NPDC049903 TaxID=3364276 RepID=UPI0037B103E7